jgi:hypothetical protein
MRARLRRIGAWTDRHAFACRLIGLGAVVALMTILSISEERQRTRFDSAYTHGMRELFRKANFWRVDDEFIEVRRQTMERAAAQRESTP